MLQLMHYTRPVRELAKSHITTDCQREHCLLCELGFVVRMLEDARGTNCQSSNFCKTVGVLAQGAYMVGLELRLSLTTWAENNLIDLMDYGKETPDLHYGHKIQAFHRFFVDSMTVEGDTLPHNPWLLAPPSDTDDLASAPITQLFGVDAKFVLSCSNCKTDRKRPHITRMVDLVYPRVVSITTATQCQMCTNLIIQTPSNESAQETDFASIIRSSILRPSSHRSTCPLCKTKMVTISSTIEIATRALPPILAVNAGVFSEDMLKFWRDTRHQTFLKPTIEMRGFVNGEDDPETVVYELRVCLLSSSILLTVLKSFTKHNHVIGNHRSGDD